MTNTILNLGSKDWIAISALIISVLVGFLNYFHTRRTFAAAFFPRAIFIPKTKTCSGGSCLGLRIKNSSHDYTMIDLVLNIYILGPRKFLFFRGKNKKIFQIKHISLEPLEEINIERIPENHNQNLEDFIAKNFPHWIQVRIEPIVGKIYHLLRDEKGKVIVTLNYMPAVAGAELVRIRKKYKLRPNFHQEITSLNQINSLEIED
jgi:hypothetical protein